MIRLAVTGTDTAVGKTVIAVALVSLLRRQGLRVAAMKPVETGVVPGVPSDAARLRAAAGDVDALRDVCPVTFAEPLAPLIAARRVGRAVDLDLLDQAFARLTRDRDAIVVEGAGGLLVPLAEQYSYADLFARWKLDLVIVAENRLGTLNHALLTVRAAQAAALRVRGVVLNSTGLREQELAMETNLESLRELLPQIAVIDGEKELNQL